MKRIITIIVLSLPVIIGIVIPKMNATADTISYDELKYHHSLITKLPQALLSIAFCESSDRQFDQKGNLVTHKNNNGTIDIGRFQINSIHKDSAEKLGFDISTYEGNTLYAFYLYAKEGTRPWNASRKCWYAPVGTASSETGLSPRLD